MNHSLCHLPVTTICRLRRLERTCWRHFCPKPGYLLDPLFLLALLVGLLGGCQPAGPPATTITNPLQASQQRLVKHLRRLPTVKSVEPWLLPEIIRDRATPALKVTTAHYRIFTSLQDLLILRQVPVFLESAFRSYCKVTGQAAVSDKKLLVYVFDSRRQWEDFTRHWAGPNAQVYLKIKAGAYYLNGACVAYHITRRSDFSVLAHEGWHQFADEMFKFRLPAWLDEGLATNFEQFVWEKGRVRFDSRFNGSRLWALRQGLAGEQFLHLADLLVLDAGRVLSHLSQIGSSGPADPKISVYYAQLYGLVRFLREENYGQHYLDFQAMLDDARLGRWPLDPQLKAEATQRRHNPSRRWNALVGPLVFKTYIHPAPGEIEPDYLSFCRKIVAGVRFKKPL